MISDKHIPVTVLSGYLGAGKTTVINHLLKESGGRRLAVLVNDFGAINVDASLISQQTENAISLTNGCVCCSITDDLGDTLEAIRAWSEPPEQVLLEASGVADPLRLARLAGHWPGFRLDAVVTAVDMETVQTRVWDKFVGQLVSSQIRAADLLVMTKVDLLEAAQKSRIETWLQGQAPGIATIHAPNGQVPPELIMGATVHRREDADAGEEMPEIKPQFERGHWVSTSPLACQRLSDQLDQFPASVHRLKGVFEEASSGRKILVQKVGARHDFVTADASMPLGFVLIGVGDKSDLMQAMHLLEQA